MTQLACPQHIWHVHDTAGAPTTQLAHPCSALEKEGALTSSRSRLACWKLGGGYGFGPWRRPVPGRDAGIDGGGIVLGDGEDEACCRWAGSVVSGACTKGGRAQGCQVPAQREGSVVSGRAQWCQVPARREGVGAQCSVCIQAQGC